MLYTPAVVWSAENRVWRRARGHRTIPYCRCWRCVWVVTAGLSGHLRACGHDIAALTAKSARAVEPTGCMVYHVVLLVLSHAFSELRNHSRFFH